ncbi:MAG TPA: orotidine-5'-phosphate decarboxylase [Acidimicrobiia bacterium]|nr:orotidine-5'-phosphate decarboxylase [Acidimicrobiia bacterium]
MTTGTDVRAHLVLALDVGSLPECEALARKLAAWFPTVKIGLELYAEAGPAAIAQLRDQGFRVFADLKLHDIPNTVGRAARVLGRHGVDFLNFHAAGGETMLRAGVEGLREGAIDAGHAAPIALGVTVLTSDADASAFDARLAVARKAGCEGVVCSGHEIARARAAELRTMVPGVRFAGGDTQDQARVVTPGAAIAAGADWIVVGRAVTAAADPEAAAARLHDEVAAALAARC